MTNIEYFKAGKYGLMVHFGLYALLGGEYNGKAGPNYAEWIQCYHKIPNKEMEALAKVFNPIFFDAEALVKKARDWGMKYIVFTAKHHDGFALYKSEVDAYNSFYSSPCKRDFLGELVEACQKYNLKFGFYYSQCIDWHEEHGGGYKRDPKGAAGDSWDNNWDFPDKGKKNYKITFENKILPQIEELLTNYGDIFIAWFDMPLDTSLEESRLIYELVKRHQPECLINSRLGHGLYDYVTLGDNEIPEKIPKHIKNPQDLNSINGFKTSENALYESACTLNNSWGYSATDQNWKSVESIYNNRLFLEEMSINYLINVGPDWLGRIPYKSEDILKKVQALYKKNKNPDRV